MHSVQHIFIINFSLYEDIEHSKKIEEDEDEVVDEVDEDGYDRKLLCEERNYNN